MSGWRSSARRRARWQSSGACHARLKRSTKTTRPLSSCVPRPRQSLYSRARRGPPGRAGAAARRAGGGCGRLESEEGEAGECGAALGGAARGAQKLQQLIKQPGVVRVRRERRPAPRAPPLRSPALPPPRAVGGGCGGTAGAPPPQRRRLVGSAERRHTPAPPRPAPRPAPAVHRSGRRRAPPPAAALEPLGAAQAAPPPLGAGGTSPFSSSTVHGSLPSPAETSLALGGAPPSQPPSARRASSAASAPLPGAAPGFPTPRCSASPAYARPARARAPHGVGARRRPTAHLTSVREAWGAGAPARVLPASATSPSAQALRAAASILR